MLKQSRIVVSVLFLFVVSLVLTAYSVRNPQLGSSGAVLFKTATSPIQSSINAVAQYFSDIWHGYIWMRGVSKENVVLKEDVLALRAEVIRLRELSQEAQALREILQLRDQTGYQGVVTSVIGVDPTGWIRNVSVDRGARDGIRERMPAVLGGAVVGQVHAVSSHAARVLLLTDRTSGVAALVQRSRARGVVIGSGSDECMMEYVRTEEDVLVGDTVVTSGFDGIFPKGLEVGEVVWVEEGSGGMFKRIRVRPSVNLEHLETLFILTDFK